MPDREPTEPQLEPSPTQRLTQPITSIKGVVSAQAELLAKLNLHTAADLLFFFPKSYEDFTQLNKISELGKEQLATVIAEVTDICLLYTSPSPRDQRGSRMPSSA